MFSLKWKVSFEGVDNKSIITSDWIKQDLMIERHFNNYIEDFYRLWLIVLINRIRKEEDEDEEVEEEEEVEGEKKKMGRKRRKMFGKRENKRERDGQSDWMLVVH